MNECINLSIFYREHSDMSRKYFIGVFLKLCGNCVVLCQMLIIGWKCLGVFMTMLKNFTDLAYFQASSNRHRINSRVIYYSYNGYHRYFLIQSLCIGIGTYD